MVIGLGLLEKILKNMIKRFENFNCFAGCYNVLVPHPVDPDLRKIGKGVYCKKDYMNKDIRFTKGFYYYVKGAYGDPHGAIEKYNIKSYLPVECISVVILEDDNKRKYNFKVKPKNNTHSKYDDFFEYFEIDDLIDKTYNYNL